LKDYEIILDVRAKKTPRIFLRYFVMLRALECGPKAGFGLGFGPETRKNEKGVFA